MEFRILGPLEALDGEASLPLGGGQQRALLAVLILNGGQTASRDRLISDLWGSDPPGTAQKMVQIYVSRLRKVLPDGLLVTRPGGYALKLEPDQLDLQRFERLRTDGRAALAAGRPADAARLLREALSLWRGPALAEFEERFALGESGRLEELRISALEDRIEADLALGRHADIVGELEALVAREPLRESLRAKHMLALYRSGRQADALAVYQQTRRILDDELGIEPTAMLKELERRILLQDPSLEIAPASTPPPYPAAPELPVEGEPVTVEPSLLVGREEEIRHLRRSFGEALAGRRQLVFVTGEAGLGKTTLVEEFLRGASAEPLLVGRGQCVEQGGAGEAYLPVLEALGRLCREPGGERLVELLAERASTWLAQMPWLVSDEELAALQPRVISTTRARMLREMLETVEAIAAERPLVLVLEDLHWGDHSTVDLMAALARRHEPARLLLLGTYRSADARVAGHPVHMLASELCVRGLCRELPLPRLRETDVATYLSARLPGAELQAGLTRLLEERAGGNPLFMQILVDGWLADGALAEEAGGIRLTVELDELGVGVPRSLRALIEGRLAALGDVDRDLLRAASVAGAEFAPVTVAAGLSLQPSTVEEQLAELARQGHVIESRSDVDWPDGTVSARFAFVHDLYQEVLYDLIPTGQKVRLHERIGAQLEDAYGARVPELATELAFHFVRGRDPERAARFLQLAAQQALARKAFREAVGHLRAAIDAGSGMSDGAARARAELELRSLLGQALVVIHGWSAEDVEAQFLRARALAEELGDNEPLVAVLLALATVYEVRGEYVRAQEIVQEGLDLDPEAPPGRQLQTQEILACSLFHQGSFTRALEHAEAGAALTDADEGHYDTFSGTFGDNAGVSCHDWAALALWYLGYPDRALDRARQAAHLAGEPSRLYSLATAQAQLAVLYQCRLEPAPAKQWAEATIELAAERGYAYREAMGRVVRGWALAAQGAADQGVEELERGLRASRATGAHMDDPHYLGLLADACLRAGRIDAGLSALAEALEIARRERSSFYEAELHRLRAGLLLAGKSSLNDVEASFEEAGSLARAQGARALELRTATSRARLWRAEGRFAEARALVAGVHTSFTEGFQTPDLVEAAALLDELEAPGRSGSLAVSPLALRQTRRASATSVRYAKSGDLNIAYQVTGTGRIDLVLVPGFVSHLEKDWGDPRHAHFLGRLGRFCRLIRFDKRGTGLSDRPPGLPDLETRMDDVRAVMDAAGIGRATIFGYSEGGPMAILFAATYPERTSALVLYGSYATRLRSDDYPWAPTVEERAAYAEEIERDWGWEADMHRMCPSADEAMARWWGERTRAAASPGAARALIEMNSLVDVRDVLATVRVPTLVLHRTHDIDVRVDEGRYIAERIPGARFVELTGGDHFVAVDPDQILDEVEEFLTGARREPETNRVLKTIVISDLVGSTETVARLGDRDWAKTLAAHHDSIRDVLARFGGEEVDTAGDGVLAIFDGPARAIRAALELPARLAALGLTVRVGVHTGEVERSGREVRGIAVHLTARVAGEAEGGEVLVTATTRDLVAGSGLSFRDRGEHTLRGIDEPRRLYAAVF